MVDFQVMFTLRAEAIFQRGPQAYEAMAALNPKAHDAAYYRTRTKDCEFTQSPYRICPASSASSPK
jgi:hypothetical protein